MSKIFLSELSAVLAEKHGIDRRTAQRFVTSVVSVVQSGLEADRIVKIKGLGTFKIIDVEARESVNVNTGERLVIDSHSKLTFLPDNTMKELVNRPFSQFETVVLNDGVNFDEPEEETPIIDAEEESTANVEIEEDEDIAPIVEEEEEVTVPVVEKEEEATVPVVEKEEEHVEEQEPSPVETIQKVVDMHEEADVETEKTESTLPVGWKTSEEVDEDSNTEQIVSTKRKFGWGHLAATALIALLVGGGAGYLLGHESSNSASTPSENVTSQAEQTTPQNEQSQVVEVRVAGGDHFVPVIVETQLFQLVAEGFDVFLREAFRMMSGGDRILFRRQAEAVVSHGMEDIVALHPLHAADDIRGGIAFRMAGMQAYTAGIGEHVQGVELGL